jgi:glycolate oxidase FAD binding subunit
VRDSLLELVMVTGDGRVVTGGGRTVKGVAGYDIPRLAVGSHGSLGVIAQVTLKLWPRPPARGWFGREGTLAERLAAAHDVMRDHWKPAAVLLTPGRLTVDLQGPAADVTAPAGFEATEEPPDPAGSATLDVGVPPRAVARVVAQIEQRGLDYIAEVGVGAIRVAVGSVDDVAALRTLARGAGGHAVIADAPDDLRTDGWGDPPAAAAIMARLKLAFDPAGVLPPIPATRPAA